MNRTPNRNTVIAGTSRLGVSSLLLIVFVFPSLLFAGADTCLREAPGSKTEAYLTHDEEWVLDAHQTREVIPGCEVMVALHHRRTKGNEPEHRLRIYAKDSNLFVLVKEIEEAGNLTADFCFLQAQIVGSDREETFLSVNFQDARTMENRFRLIAFTADGGAHEVAAHLKDFKLRDHEYVDRIDAMNYCNGNFPFWTRVWTAYHDDDFPMPFGGELSGFYKIIGLRRWDEEHDREIAEYELVPAGVERLDLTDPEQGEI